MGNQLGESGRRFTCVGMEVKASSGYDFTTEKPSKSKEKIDENVEAVSGFNPMYWKLELPSGYNASDFKVTYFEFDKRVQPFFYKDSLDDALVFEAYEVENSTSKSKYIRSNMREQMQPGSNDVNWTMKTGGVLETEFQVTKMSKDEKGKYHRTLLIQVDGRTSEKDTKALGLKKPVSMPFVKIFWQNGVIRVKRRVLKDETLVGDALLSKKSWKEESADYYSKKVDFEKVKLRLELKKGRIEIRINDEKPIVFADFNVVQWYFENYFTVGNYLQTRDFGAHSIVKYYDLNVFK